MIKILNRVYEAPQTLSFPYFSGIPSTSLPCCLSSRQKFLHYFKCVLHCFALVTSNTIALPAAVPSPFTHPQEMLQFQLNNTSYGKSSQVVQLPFLWTQHLHFPVTASTPSPCHCPPNSGSPSMFLEGKVCVCLISVRPLFVANDRKVTETHLS